jgi:uncharacterized protein with PIN domain
MPDIELEFRGELVAMVRPGRRGPPGPRLQRSVPEIPSLKDAFEAAGIPHVEVGRLATAGGRSLNLDDPCPTGETIVVYPVRPYRLDPVRFVCDQPLGKLTRLLRVMGFDTAWSRDWLEPDIARRAVNEDRAVLSRGRAVLTRKIVDRGLLVIADAVDAQAVEVVRRFDLVDRVQMFGRCSLCNGQLRTVAKADVAARIPPRTAAWLDEYYLCTTCDHLYWEGTHVEKLRRRVAEILSKVRSGKNRSDGSSTSTE